jgi:hypothetical protein
VTQFETDDSYQGIASAMPQVRETEPASAAGVTPHQQRLKPFAGRSSGMPEGMP